VLTPSSSIGEGEDGAERRAGAAMRYRMRRGGWNRVGDGTRKKERVKRSGGKKDTVVLSDR
jgi:hypothetical protein